MYSKVFFSFIILFGDCFLLAMYYFDVPMLDRVANKQTKKINK